MERDWRLYNNIDANTFLLEMLELGKPLEVSLVGAFDEEGRGSRRDIPLPFHKDGDYTTEYKDKIKYVGLYCLREGGDASLLIEDSYLNVLTIKLKTGQAIVFNNTTCRHAREGTVSDRVLLRVWIG
jgi:hypothetical protein